MDATLKWMLTLQLLWAVASPGRAQVRPEIMALANRIKTVAITSVSYTSKNFQLKDSLAITLLQSATVEELLELTEHASPIIRTTALFALLNRPEKDSLELQELVPRHFYDTAEVHIEIWGEYKDNWKPKVGELFLHTIGGYTNRPFWENDGFALAEDRQRWLDSLFICSPTSFSELKQQLFWKWEPQEAMYPCIRQLVESGQDSFASTFLAKYQNESDIELITAYLPAVDGEWSNYTWLPFWFFRHPQMFSFLEGHLGQGWRNVQYQRRVAEYQDRQAAVVLDSLYARIMQLDQKNRRQLINTLARTIEGNYDSVYATLYLKILTKHSENANPRVPEGLWLTHADTLYRLSLAWKTGNRAEQERSAEMLPEVIQFLETHNKDSLVAEIISRIQPGLDMRYYVEHQAEMGATMKAYRHIYRTKAPYFVDPLIEILKKEPLAKNRFFIAKLLHEYNDPAIDERLALLFREFPELAPGLQAAEEGGS
ncbi:MAG: hypothetical protein KDD28_28525, partial [Phaeodactylibacter sp.]|nr:hypothetical protein [Phaeodactylibacter sp.]